MPQPNAPSGSPAGKGRLGVALATATVCLVGLASVVVLAWSEIETTTEVLAGSAMASIDHLASLDEQARETQRVLRRYVAAEDAESRSAAGARLDWLLGRLEDQIRSDRILSHLDGGSPLWDALESARERLDVLVREARRLVDEGEAGAPELFERSLGLATAELVEAASDAMGLHARSGRMLVERLRAMRRRVEWLGLACFGLASTAGVLGGVHFRRQALLRRRVEEEHTRTVEERAAELELFAGRMAHDIRNPLMAVRLAAEVLQNREPTPRNLETIRRIVSALGRAEAIVSALLDFARAGAHPEPGAGTPVADGLANIVNGMTPSADEANIELRLESVPSAMVACSEGVLLSLVGNLVRNAIRYMGSSPVRRITVHAIISDGFLRTEVADTGPGIPRVQLARLFDPYVRGDSHAGEGLGLGLATVRKLVEAHGGRVGLETAVGVGSTFWFELPLAEGSRDLARTVVGDGTGASRAS